MGLDGDFGDTGGIGGIGNIETLGDAVAHVTRLVDRQLERGRQEGFQANEAVSGDTVARNALYTLLPDAQQRSVFLRVAGQMQNWPRLRPLFGAPPYNFLGADESSMMRAGGIAAGRSSMSYESAGAANYTQFGAGQLVDEEGREYRVVPAQTLGMDDPVPWRLDLSASRQVQLQVRVKKRDRKRKLELLKDGNARRALTFPRPGERIRLAPTPSMRALERRRANMQDAVLLVQRVAPRGESAATASLVASLM